MKKLLLPILFLMSAIAFSQTTVTLEDQCNCEVLSGTDVTVPGSSSPAGADLGDLYVNTDTGTIYFWDGDSWELSSGSNPEIQDFVFDETTGELTLTMQGGSTSVVDLSYLFETETTLIDNADGTFTYTNEDGVVTLFDAKRSTVLDNGDGTFTLTDDSGNSATVDTNNTVTTLVDNADGSFTYTSENGTTTTFTETLSTLVDNADGTFTYTNEDGVVTLFDAKRSTVLDNGDGTFTLTDDSGNSATVDTNNTVTTLVDNADGSFT
ncbi:MAG: hypothetical protein ACSHWV_09225, partial [Cellulophaga fucicola]